jgi:hypothetical protein
MRAARRGCSNDDGYQARVVRHAGFEQYVPRRWLAADRRHPTGRSLTLHCRHCKIQSLLPCGCFHGAASQTLATKPGNLLVGVAPVGLVGVVAGASVDSMGLLPPQ